MMHLIAYAAAYLSLAPCALLLAGAAKKTSDCASRVNRLQLEGAVIITLVMSFTLFFLHRVLAMEQVGETSFAYWYERGEYGLFAVGIILFALGFFLERRPRPGLERWPLKARLLSGGWMGGWLLFAAFASGRQYAWDMAVWSPARTAAAWSILFFAIIYCHRAFVRPGESRHAEGDLIGIEE